MTLTKWRLAITVIAIYIVGTLYVIMRTTNTSFSRQPHNEVTYYRIDQLAQECHHYRHVVGTWPTTLLSMLVTIQSKDTNIVIDGWGRQFAILAFSNAPSEIYLVSYGADGRPGGRGSNADIVEHLK